MINAHVEMDLNDHIAVVAANLLDIIIKANGELIFETLMSQFLKKYEKNTPDQLMDASVFLYMIGCIDIDRYKVVLNHV